MFFLVGCLDEASLEIVPWDPWYLHPQEENWLSALGDPHLGMARQPGAGSISGPGLVPLFWLGTEWNEYLFLSLHH